MTAHVMQKTTSKPELKQPTLLIPLVARKIGVV
jgi:hypothetical protein